jgi:hypothetical protein
LIMHVVRVIAATAITMFGAAERSLANEQALNIEFERIGQEYVEKFASFSPVRATGLGDHRFDGELDEVSEDAREKRLRWIRDLLEQLDRVDADKLSRSNQVDYSLLKHALDARLWRLTELREWEWNPLIYTGLAGDSIYGLMARDFAPPRERLISTAKRLEQFPRFLEQVRATLNVSRVPAVHAKMAVSQNLGVLKTLDNMVLPLLDERLRVGTLVRTAGREADPLLRVPTRTVRAVTVRTVGLQPVRPAVGGVATGPLCTTPPRLEPPFGIPPVPVPVPEPVPVPRPEAAPALLPDPDPVPLSEVRPPGLVRSPESPERTSSLRATVGPALGERVVTAGVFPSSPPVSRRAGPSPGSSPSTRGWKPRTSEPAWPRTGAAALGSALATPSVATTPPP